MVHLYCGDGKGKTTAAMGLAMRFAGSGGKVLVFQFLKDNTSSERMSMSHIEKVTLIEGPEHIKFVWDMTEEEKENVKQYYSNVLGKLSDTKDYGMVILDEAVAAVNTGLIEEKRLIELMKLQPEKEWVITGREPVEQLKEIADYVTEMIKIKHPFDKGIKARKGIES